MSDRERRESALTRRRLLAGLAATGTAVVAGCGGTDTGDGTSGTPTDSDGGNETGTATATPTPTPVPEQLPAPVKGNPDATVTLAVFEDYACPHCAHYNADGFPKIDDAYVSSGDIRYEHRDLPIPVADPGSWQAANAARAVQDRHGDEGFWSYAGALFENSSSIPGSAPDLIGSLASDQGYDSKAIRTAAVNRLYRKTVRGDRQTAVDLGAEATPTFVLNGEIVASGYGESTVETLTTAIDTALSESG